MKLMRGLVIAIEPMINMGKKEVNQEDDGWTITTKDGLPSAHFEHTVAIAKGKPEILTTFEIIEQTESGKLPVNKYDQTTIHTAGRNHFGSIVKRNVSGGT
jgi:hypothetical protein